MPHGDGLNSQTVPPAGQMTPSATELGSRAYGEVRIPLSKIDRSDPILRSYLAPPAEPPSEIVSPLATAARRESAGIGFALWAFSLLILLIVLGDFLMAMGISIVLGFVARVLIFQSRRGAVRADEARLMEQVKSQLDVYHARRAAWERLSYCPTQRLVIDEVTGATRPLYAAHELLVLSTVVSQATNAPAEQ